MVNIGPQFMLKLAARIPTTICLSRCVNTETESTFSF